MLRERKNWLARLMTGLTIPLLVGIATPVLARSVSLKDAGVTLWIFILIGAAIVLLQLIPAAILFFSFVGTSSSMVFKRKREAAKVSGEGKAVLPGIEPTPAEK